MNVEQRSFILRQEGSLIPVNVGVYTSSRCDWNGRPILFIPGWGCSTHTEYGTFLEEVASYEKRPVYAIEYSATLSEIETTYGSFSNAYQDRKYSLIRRLLKLLRPNPNDNDIDLIAYSEGAIYAIKVAYNFVIGDGDIFLLNPAGITGKESYASIILSAFLNASQGISTHLGLSKDAKARLRGHAGSIRQYLKKGTGTMLEGMAPGRIDLEAHVLELLSESRRIRILGYDQDMMIPVKKLQERYKHCHRNLALIIQSGTHQQIFIDPHHAALLLTGKCSQEY